MNALRNGLLRVLGPLLGLTTLACPGYGANIPAPAYGAPHAEYHLSGTVTDAQSQAPIPGIKISFLGASIYTNEDGKFTLDTTTSATCSSCAAKAEDVDGATHGSYQDKDIALNLTQTKPADKWDLGTFAQDGLAVHLDPKP